MESTSIPIQYMEESVLLGTIKKVTDLPENVDLTYQEKIEKVEEILLKEDQLEIPVQHFFFEGMYIRQIVIPKGTLCTSTYHKRGQFDIMASGEMSVLTEEGIVRIKAPYYAVSNSGLKRLGYAHTDVLWVDIRAMDNIGVEKAEKLLYTTKYKELLEHKAKTSKEDFTLLLEEYGISAETAREQTENKADRVRIDLEKYEVHIADSDIEGKGVWPNKVFKSGDIIGPAKLGDYRTQLGRYTNHSNYPNAEMIMQDGDIFLVATQTIEKVEIVTDYRISMALVGIKEKELCLV